MNRSLISWQRTVPALTPGSTPLISYFTSSSVPIFSSRWYYSSWFSQFCSHRVIFWLPVRLLSFYVYLLLFSAVSICLPVPRSSLCIWSYPRRMTQLYLILFISFSTAHIFSSGIVHLVFCILHSSLLFKLPWSRIHGWYVEAL